MAGAASLERLRSTHKEALGEALLEAVQRAPVPPYAFWALTRLGARVLLYGPLNAVVHHQVVEALARRDPAASQPGNESERLAWAFCLAQLARRTGQRALDVDDGHREQVLAVLRAQSVPEHWVQDGRGGERAGGRGAGADVRRLAADRPAAGGRPAE